MVKPVKPEQTAYEVPDVYEVATPDLTVAEPTGEELEKGCYESFKEWPKSVFFIVGNECCERFSYYGMRTILTLYVRNILKLSQDDSIALFHGFTVAAYFTPILGSILADGFIGKFHTILWLSLLYACGNVILAVAAFFKEGHAVHPGLDALGLAIIALGTGGIKPCVSPFGADQFKKGQEKLLVMFFSVFYFSINAGSTVSTFITPIFRSIPCLGQDSCYPLAFGVPAILMIVACVFFMIGSFWYVRYPPKGNVLAQVFRYMSTAIRNRWRFTKKHDHWLEYYMDDHSCKLDHECQQAGKCQKEQFGKDIRAFLRVLIMFLPLPIFWALYDQQGSRWVLQASLMDGRLNEAGDQVILPDQTQVINPICIMILIPIFQAVIYPLVGRCVKITALRKMTLGGLLAVLAYVVAGLVQSMVNDSMPVLPASGKVDLYLINPYDHNMTFSVPGISRTELVDSNSYFKLHNVDCSGQSCGTIEVESPYNGNRTVTHLPTDFSGSKPYSYGVFYGLIGPDFTITDMVPLDPKVDQGLQKSSQGNGQFKMTLTMGSFFTGKRMVAVCLLDHIDDQSCKSYDTKSADQYFEAKLGPGETFSIHNDEDNTYTTLELKPGIYGVYASAENSTDYRDSAPEAVFEKKPWGGIYAGYIVSVNGTITIALAQLAPDNSVHMFWQLPQMIIISIGEILFSITGNEFSYSQAPLSMKSVISACWLLSVAIGDVIDLFIAELHPFDDESYIYYLFAGIMLVVIIIFALLAQFWYTYVFYIHEGESENQPLKKANPEGGFSNDAYTVDDEKKTPMA